MSGINEQVINAEIYQIGPQGIPGEAATISVGTVTTGAAGSEATVINSGTPNAAVLDFVIPQGAQGLQGIQGPQGIQGLTGLTGNGIDEIVLYDTTGLIKTYRINFTDNTHFDFEVSDGSSISDIQKTSTSGLVDTYTITLTNGDTHTFTVTNGAKGDKGETGEVGNGILGIVKMSTTGLVDNYQINFTNGTHYNYDLANGKGITSITLLSWVGLIKTYRILFNDGTYFDYEVTNGAGGQTEWGGITGIITQQTDLQNSFHALKSYEDAGEVLTDAEGLADVKSYAHSTFDLSKFEVYGSPNITSDGIASGFSSSNYLRLSNSIADPVTFTNSAVLEIEFTPSSVTDTGNMDFLGNDFSQGILLRQVNNELRGFISTSGSGWASGNFTIYNNLVADTSYKIRVECSTTDTKIYVNGNLEYTNTAGKLYGLPYYIGLGNFSGTIDLKQVYYEIDGVPLFSGNKTGIDVIKSDDYTVVGSPTISDDGVASGFSSSDFVKIPLFDVTKPFKLKLKLNTDDLSSNTANKYAIIVDQSILFGIRRAYDGSQNVICYLGNGTAYNTINASQTGIRVEDNTDIWLQLEFTGNNYFVSYSTDGTNYSIIQTVNSSTTIGQKDYLYIGSSNIGMSSVEFWRGSIDLNSFKIYVDGDLVYQPCLKIPYTESKTGSKVVNSIYRNRVNDMYEQFGYANYYTLSDTDFTLPQGEIYGLIGQRTLRDSYRNGINYWELYSNRDLEQGGSCTSGTEVTFTKPFADTNYVLSVPYSAKSATAFTPTQTGDWIAKGKGAL